VEQFRWSERVEISLSQPPGQLRSWRRYGQGRPFLPPLDIFRRLTRNKPPEEEVHNARAHGLKDSSPGFAALGTTNGRQTGPFRTCEVGVQECGF
jgi:hypothetical protein